MDIRRSGRSSIARCVALALGLATAFGAGSAFAGPDKVTVMALFTNKAMLVIDGKQRMVAAGETTPEGVTLVSADADGAVLEIDGQRRPYGLGAQISSSFAGPRTRNVRLFPTSNGMYLASGSINGLPIEFIVDTGATLVSMNGRDARRIGIDYRVVGEPARSTTASGVAQVFLVDLERVQLGDITLRNVRGAVHEGDFPPQVLLGQSFLNRLDMSRDGSMLTLTLQQ